MVHSDDMVILRKTIIAPTIELGAPNIAIIRTILTFTGIDMSYPCKKLMLLPVQGILSLPVA
jgi:hypothetical protein